MLKVSVSLCQIELSCLGAGYSPFPGFVSSSAKMRLLSQATNSNDSEYLQNRLQSTAEKLNVR